MKDYPLESRVEDDYPHEGRGTWHTYLSCQLEMSPDFLGIWGSHCWVPNILFYLNKINTALNNLQ